MYVAAFAVAGYGRTGRTLKPFNPLLGETFEFDRTSDLGWRYISEQVSHHPPIAAVHCEGRGWTVWLQVSSDVKFTGRTISVEPKGSIHLVFKGSNHHYTWERLHTVIHNVLFGKLWIENHGEMNIINHAQGGRAFVKFESSGMFGGETKQVYGAVHNAKQEIVWILRGAWDSFLESVSPLTAIKVEGAVDIFGKEIANENVVAKLPRWKEVWDGRPEDVRTEIQYCFTQFTIELNESEDGVAPTDSRNRPDQRIHENGDWKKADRCKYALEAAQRARKKETSTVWFQKTWDQYENDFVYKSKGTYWKKKQEKNWEPTQIFEWNDGTPP
ncbi:oxysterol-binding protein 1 [Eurytemora carolleeae]|uniref:oxysterol-binding protein 1 n=1 Tax=Eurytemora carolleeae TaxID=1294199 RepID=UPI000C774B67|nr:oxysterol-binding protein 1 [Eurytemora carolleeae]|eukprot:XP_023338515.1 oxysterol-binding protein 1-like [Eurytemora affinis]